MSTTTLIIGAITAIATMLGIFWRVFYGKDATERKIQKLEVELERLKNESEKILAEGRADDFLILDKQRVLVAKKLNQILRRQ